MTELAALNIRITGDAGGIKAAATVAATSLEKVDDAANKVEVELNKVTVATTKATVGISEVGSTAARASVDLGKIGTTALNTTASIIGIDRAAVSAVDGLRDINLSAINAVGSLHSMAIAGDMVNTRSTQLSGGLGNAASSGGSLANSMRGVSQQLSQVGQQTMATGNFVQALAIQLPDIGVAFGAVGAAAGLLAGIALPLLMSAFAGTGEKAAALAAATKGLSDAVAEFRIQAAAITLGVDQEEVLVVQELNRLVAERIALESQMAQVTGRALIPLELQRRSIEAAIVAEQKKLDTYRQARDELAKIQAKADEIKGSISDVTQEVISAKDAMAALVASAPSGGWLSGAISDAAALGSKLWDAAAAQAELAAFNQRSLQGSKTYSGRGGDPRTSNQQGGGFVYTGPALDAENNVIKSGGGGGGGGENPLIADLEALQQSLLTQEQAQIDSFARQQETLVSALDQRLITQQEYAAMMETAEFNHANEMAMIKEKETAMVRQAATSMYGSLEGLLQMFAGKSKAAAIAAIALNKGLAIASIIQNTAAAQMRAYAELGPVAGAAMAAKIGIMGKMQAAIVAASGLAQAAGAGGGGGGGGAAVASAGAGGGITEMRTANINFYGGFQPTQETIGAIASGLNDWLGDGGRLNIGAA